MAQVRPDVSGRAPARAAMSFRLRGRLRVRLAFAAAVVVFALVVVPIVSAAAWSWTGTFSSTNPVPYTGGCVDAVWKGPGMFGLVCMERKCVRSRLGPVSGKHVHRLSKQ